jgi:hypothetical protein
MVFVFCKKLEVMDSWCSSPTWNLLRAAAAAAAAVLEIGDER